MSNQGYCRTQGNLLFQPQPLDLTPEALFLILFPPIQLLFNDDDDDKEMRNEYFIYLCIFAFLFALH